MWVASLSEASRNSDKSKDSFRPQNTEMSPEGE
jgi:hypothetical protein